MKSIRSDHIMCRRVRSFSINLFFYFFHSADKIDCFPRTRMWISKINLSLISSMANVFEKSSLYSKASKVGWYFFKYQNLSIKVHNLIEFQMEKISKIDKINEAKSLVWGQNFAERERERKQKSITTQRTKESPI